MYQFADGFDNYGTSYNMVAGYPWSFIQGTATVVTTDFRFAPPAGLPGGCVELNQNNYLRQNLIGNPNEMIVCFGFKTAALPASGETLMIYFWDSGASQCGLAITSNGALQFWRGDGNGNLKVAQIGPTSTAGLVSPNTWYGFVADVVFSNTVGSVSLYMNGGATAVIPLTGSLNTGPSGHAYATQCSIGPDNSSTGLMKFDDVMMLDTTGAFFNSRPTTNTRIYTKVPTGIGTYTNWTPVGLTNNWQNAAVMPPSLSDYNLSNVGAQHDSYAVPLIGLTSSPLLVLVRGSLWEDDAQTHTPSLLMRTSVADGGVDSIGAATTALTSAPLFYDTPFQNDPNTGAPWSGPNADAAQIGVVEG